MRKKPYLNIGLVLSIADGRWNLNMMQGLKSTAAAFGVNITQYCCGSINGKNPQYNIISELINTDQLDGLIITSSIKAPEFGDREFMDFCQRYKSIPIITVNHQLDSHPCVISEFYNVAYGAFKHLIDVHNITNIVLMLNSIRSMFPQCVRAYKDIHQQYGIPVFPDRLIAKIPNKKDDDELCNILFHLMEKKTQAIVTFDHPAVRCIRLLSNNGFHLPDDIAIMGLNNHPSSKLTTPPLSTMDRDQSKLGAVIINNMLKMIHGKTIEKTIQLEPRLIIRRSCGCFEQSGRELVKNNIIGESVVFQESFLDNKNIIKSDLLKTQVYTKELENNIENLLLACNEEIQDPGKGSFCDTISEIMKKQNPYDTQLYIWHTILSRLIQWATPFIRDNKKLFTMQKVWQLSRLLISDRFQYHQGLELIHETQSFEKQRLLSESLSFSNNRKEMMKTLAKLLPTNGISYAYIVIYENPKSYKYQDPAPEWSWLVMGYKGKKILETGEKGLRFRTKNLLPEKVWKNSPFPAENPFYIIIEALVLSHNQIGYIILGISSQTTDTSYWLRNIISTALQRVNYYNEIQKQTTKIQDLNIKLNKENLKMRAELKIVKQLQRMILPGTDDLKTVKNYDIAVYFKSSSEVGGDYYDIIVDNDRTLIGIGDVTGHGLESGVIMIMAQTAIRTMVFSGTRDLLEIYKVVNQVLYENIKNIQTDKKLTLLMAELNNDKIRLIGFHDDPFIARNNGTIETIDTTELGTLLGAVPELRMDIKPVCKVLARGDSFVLYTDGITEARGLDNSIYNEKRLQKVISRNSTANAEQIKNSIMTDLVKYTGKKNYTDDASLLILKLL